MKIQEVITKNLTVPLAAADRELLTEVQTALAKLGLYPSTLIDGIYGPKMQAGWTNFKKSTYQIDYDTMGAGSAKLLLEEVDKKPKPIKDGSGLAATIHNVCLERNYLLDTRQGAVNIIGIEGYINGKKNDDAPDRWNDTILLLTYQQSKPHILISCVGTTEPGRYYTINPLNKNGCARLQLGQQKKIWSVGRHRGYEAMQQTGAATLVRDKNRNNFRDDAVTVETGNGINLHTSKTTGWRGSFNSFIGQWSAGCVVVKDPNEFLQLMKLIKNSLQYKESPYTRFDFTLLWKDWL